MCKVSSLVPANIKTLISKIQMTIIVFTMRHVHGLKRYSFDLIFWKDTVLIKLRVWHLQQIQWHIIYKISISLLFHKAKKRKKTSGKWKVFTMWHVQCILLSSDDLTNHIVTDAVDDDKVLLKVFKLFMIFIFHIPFLLILFYEARRKRKHWEMKSFYNVTCAKYPF